ncbi:hypothetical protein CROQUDRAFT_54137 [Cronartium quercuum f. sp. fusiforme G11]|uniref:Uncharacterized protein n=1 Tax=Cronartium quercuum f. sp. fusiforme G11 TaxID=708437 RepID=A0A9P6N5Q8_9BASI|nr:hypothetical protein CROQUDRAFT_54137 [Cronartium quercuum f. sp. fusiforme G11]
MARNPPHTDPPYKSLDFYIKMPSLVKNSLVILDAAGTKFLAWKNHLWDTVDYVTTIDNYLATDRPPGEDVIRSMIVCSIDDSFISQIERSWSAKATFDYISSMFHFPSRTTHIGHWQDILTSKFEPGDSLNAHLMKIRSKIEDLDRTGFEWSKDSILGICMQLSLPTTGEISFTNINMVLDARLRSSPAVKITARKTEEAIRAEYHRLGAIEHTVMPNIAALNL